MNLKTATLIALICVVVHLVLSLVLPALQFDFPVIRLILSWVNPVLLDGGIFLFLFILYLKQRD